ncbi:hypothetical protein L1D51_17375 [Pseudoalteromonas shioyasakiensis]|uniref:hypothetical protein n=1 Tax=Pseudoalteromonas shioyasakiensis TaxID=1190813 RepID=UPI001EFE0757|nr:hypothetical protein [Pseudoalteromonas shioyasakiensis]MCG9735760.1 hypothetical protein [Pseudoalteromonas shioyasakiensis]
MNNLNFVLTLFTAALLIGCETTSQLNKSAQEQASVSLAFKSFADGAVRVVTDNGKNVLTGTLIKAQTGYYLLSSMHGFNTLQQDIVLKQGANSLSAKLGVVITIPKTDVVVAKLLPEANLDFESQLFSSTPVEVFKKQHGQLVLSQLLYCFSMFEQPSGVVVSILEQRHIAALTSQITGIVTQEPSAPSKSGGICTTSSGEVVGLTKGNLIGKDPFTVGVIEQLEGGLASLISRL